MKFDSDFKSVNIFFNLNRNINGDFAKFEAEEILAASPEYKKDLKHVKFSRNYFLDFFARYGWKWGIHKGNKKYFPEKVIQDEVNRIREKMKNFTANNIWNADETAIFVNDIGRNTFSPNDHVGRLINNDKQRVTGLLYIDAAGNIHVPLVIFMFQQ